MARYFWRERAAVVPGTWMLNFAVLEDGVPIGVQDLRAVDFTPLRTVSTGSWLTRSRQGDGLGTEMRVAVLAFAFDHLGAEVAESGALDWNEASLGVSRKLGYRDNGVKRVTARPGTSNARCCCGSSPTTSCGPTGGCASRASRPRGARSSARPHPRTDGSGVGMLRA